MIARSHGGLTFGMDVRGSRVDCAHQLGLGAFNSEDQADERIRDLTNGGPDVVIEASGRPESIERAARLARVGGRVVMVASYHSPAEIKPGRWVTRGISLSISCSHVRQSFASCAGHSATHVVSSPAAAERRFAIRSCCPCS